MMPTLFLNMYPMVMLQKVNLNGTLFLVIKQMFFKGVVYVNKYCPELRTMT
jgi:hypothetical protein